MKKPVDLAAFLEMPVRRIPFAYEATRLSAVPRAVEDADAGNALMPATLQDLPTESIAAARLAVEPMLAPDAMLPEYFLDNYAKSALVQRGISKHAFEHFKQLAHLDYDQLAGLLGVSRKTLISKKGAEVFDRLVSEQMLSLAELYSHGAVAMGGLPVFVRWLQVPCRALGGQLPFGLLATQFGRREVDQLLGRMEWGVYS